MMSLLVLGVHLLAADPGGYPKPDLLVEPAALAKPHDFRVLDLRNVGKYEAGHVPGAVAAPLAKWSKAVTAGSADAAFWKTELAAVGVAPKQPVVVYSDDVRDGCRGWWLLKLAGVPDVRLLHGGWKGYVAAGGTTQKEAATAKADPHDWQPAAARNADKSDVLRMTKEKKGTVIDTRSEDEFKAGRIPGAVRLEWTELLDEEAGRFKPAADIAKLFKERNIDPGAENCSY